MLIIVGETLVYEDLGPAKRVKALRKPSHDMVTVRFEDGREEDVPLEYLSRKGKNLAQGHQLFPNPSA